MEDIIIIGAGPSGIMAAIQASYLGASVTVLERNDKPLKKLYATGNGRCNFSNLYMDGDVYRGRDPEFAFRVIEDYDRNDLLLFFHNLGMMTKHIGDYIYPGNEQARTVADVLLLECRRLKIEVKCNEKVIDITRDNGFIVKTENHEYRSRKLIVSTGGKASPAHGSDGNLNRVIKGLKIGLLPQRRALVPLTYTDKALSKLSGVRIKCSVNLTVDGKKVTGEQGEIIINKDNISGIPIMQMSRYATSVLDEGASVSVSIDLFPDEDMDGTNRLIYNAFKGYRYGVAVMGREPGEADPRYDRTCLEALALLINEKLAMYCLNLTGILPGELSANVKDKKLKMLAELLKDMRVGIKGDAGWDRAQVTAGGVDTRELTGELESVKVPGLYFTGELCDIDGTCGGYNLQWAFSSGAVAGRGAAGKVCKKDKGV